MRARLLLGTILLPAGLLAAGCTPSVPHVAGSAAPVTAAPAPSSAVPSQPSSPAPSGTAASPSGRAPTSTATSSRPSSSPVLGPNGLGALKLGMTSRQATATGLIAPWTGKGGAGCSLQSHLRAASGKDPGSDGLVYYSGDLGVEIIDAYGSVRTPQGIHVGSSSAAMLKAYPDWTNAEREDPKSEGRGYAKVPGNSKAVYRMVTRNGKVVELTLQYKHQDCYE